MPLHHYYLRHLPKYFASNKFGLWVRVKWKSNDSVMWKCSSNLLTESRVRQEEMLNLFWILNYKAKLSAFKIIKGSILNAVSYNTLNLIGSKQETSLINQSLSL